MHIELSCPSCGRAFKVSREHLGKQGKCQCGQAIAIRETPATAVVSPPPQPAPPPAPPVAPTAVPEKPKGFWATVKSDAAKSRRDYQATYMAGPFDLKPKSDGMLGITDDGLTFKSIFLRKEIFSISYGALAFVSGAGNVLRIVFVDQTGNSSSLQFSKMALGPTVEAIADAILEKCPEPHKARLQSAAATTNAVAVVEQPKPVSQNLPVPQSPTTTEQPKGFWAAMKDVAAKAGEVAAKMQLDNPVIYIGGPYDLKADSEGILTLGENEFIFKSSILRREFFRLPYSTIAEAHVDTAERLGKLRTVGAWALAGPLGAAIVGFGLKKKDKLLKFDFTDETGLKVTVVFGKANFGPDMDTLQGRILTQRRASFNNNGSGQPTQPAPASAPVEDVASTLEKLASLRDKGILTEEEFQKKKNDLLSRM